MDGGGMTEMWQSVVAQNNKGWKHPISSIYIAHLSCCTPRIQHPCTNTNANALLVFLGTKRKVATAASSTPTWAAVMTAAATSADLPAHSVHSGHNSGGNTYVCRVHSAGGETGVSGSASCAGPYHCMVAVGNKPYTPTVGYDVLVAAV